MKVALFAIFGWMMTIVAGVGASLDVSWLRFFIIVALLLGFAAFLDWRFRNAMTEQGTLIQNEIKLNREAIIKNVGKK